MEDSQIDARARGLIEDLESWSREAKSRSCKPTIYETAWVSMLFKPRGDGVTEWAFPESFQFVLDHQQPHGGWTSCDSKVDAILSTLAATLAVKKHWKSLELAQKDAAASLDSRILNAVAFLDSEMSDWEPEAGSHVGFELLVPALLLMLEFETVNIRFPGRQSLMKLNKNTVAHFSPQILHENEPSPMLYFLEAFITHTDFEKLSHHKAHGSIMHSPSSTAAYLMGLRNWEDDCEAYLRDAIQATGTSGGVPSNFPCQSSESAFIVDALLESGFSRANLGTDKLASVTKSASDYPSTAKVSPSFGIGLSCLFELLISVRRLIQSLATFVMEEIITNLLLCKMNSPESTIPQIETLQERMMGQLEINGASFITRCRILKTLLRSPQAGDCGRHVSSVADSLCGSWWDGNLSPFYAMMLYAEAFAQMHGLSENGSLILSVTENTKRQVPITLVQVLAKLLSAQNNDGSWGRRDCAETTAYALLALLAIASLPYVHVMKMEIRNAVAEGRRALLSMRSAWAKPHDLWVGKTAYGSAKLSEAYSLAAMKKPLVEHIHSEQDRAATDVQAQKILALSRFFSTVGRLNKESLAVIKVSMLEASFYQPLLKVMRKKIFPQTLAKENDGYLDYTPIVWILSSTCDALFTSPQYLFDMMVLTMYIFLVDEYMESKVAQFSKDEFTLFRDCLEEIHPEGDSSTDGLDLERGRSERVRTAVSVFKDFADAVANYPLVADASRSDLLELRSETKKYLLYHLEQLGDNARFAQQSHQPGQRTEFLTPTTSYQTWVHTVGAGHVSAPFAFAFFACSMGGSLRCRADCFTGLKQKLTAYSMNAHLGAFCRMYNDYGSIARDRDERNLNSVNFPEFFADGAAGTTAALDPAKATLLDAAAYERRCASDAADVLYGSLEAEGAAGRKVADCLRVFFSASALWSDLYVTRDVTNSVK